MIDQQSFKQCFDAERGAKPLSALMKARLIDAYMCYLASYRFYGMVGYNLIINVNYISEFCFRRIDMKFLDRPTVEKFVNAPLTSKLGYCNSLMFGSPKQLITQRHMHQNHAARVITQGCKFDHITPVLIVLHWLSVKQRNCSKILPLIYKALYGLEQAHLR